MTHCLELSVPPGRFAIFRLAADALMPNLPASGFVSITRTNEEMSVVAPEGELVETLETDNGWRMIKVAGPLPFELTGILSSLVDPLADVGVSFFAISTFLTDYFMVKEESLGLAVTTLVAYGHRFS